MRGGVFPVFALVAQSVFGGELNLQGPNSAVKFSQDAGETAILTAEKIQAYDELLLNFKDLEASFAALNATVVGLNNEVNNEESAKATTVTYVSSSGDSTLWDLTQGELELNTPGTWTLVPDGEMTVTIDIWGAGGGGAGDGNQVGGGAGHAVGDVTFVKGATYTIYVGGGGAATSGRTGGGGGGASAFTMQDDVLLVGGGGGGGAGYGNFGGPGGGVAGGDGSSSNGRGGHGATAANPGSGGTGGRYGGQYAGASGSGRNGGNGGGHAPNSNGGSSGFGTGGKGATVGGDGGGGGGGGGYRAGGGGNGDSWGGGGGGGSGYIHPTLTSNGETTSGSGQNQGNAEASNGYGKGGAYRKAGMGGRFVMKII